MAIEMAAPEAQAKDAGAWKRKKAKRPPAETGTDDRPPAAKSGRLFSKHNRAPSSNA